MKKKKVITGILMGGVLGAAGIIGYISSLPNNSYDCTQPIKFTITNAQGYSFTDALIMKQEDCEVKTDQDIADMETVRFNNWINTINNSNGDFSPNIDDIRDPLDDMNQ